MQALLSILDIIIGPLFTFGLGCITLFVIKGKIDQWVGGTQQNGAKYFDIYARLSARQSNISASEEFEREIGSSLLSSLLEQIGQFIKTDLDNRPLKDAVEREKYLIRRLAHISITSEFEFAYLFIWGSQLTTLQLLNIRDSEGAILENVKTVVYEPARSRWPDDFKNFSFDRWWEYLERRNLAVRRNGTAYITDVGRGFLTYITEKGYDIHKDL